MLNNCEQKVLEIFNDVLDTDSNNLIDAYETYGIIVMLSNTPLKDKISCTGDAFETRVWRSPDH